MEVSQQTLAAGPEPHLELVVLLAVAAKHPKLPAGKASSSILKALAASSSSVGDEEDFLVAASSLRVQEMPALSNHSLKTQEHEQHIWVTQLEATFSPLIPWLHGIGTWNCGVVGDLQDH